MHTIKLGLIAILVVFLSLSNAAKRTKVKKADTPVSNQVVVSVGVAANWDNNIADNITHVSDEWVVPFASLAFKQKINRKQSWSLQGDFQYESYLETRSPTLNAPIDMYTLRGQQVLSKDLSFNLFGRVARTLDADWNPAKYLGRVGLGTNWDPGRWNMGVEVRHDWENYGDHSQDGNTRWLLLDLRNKVWRSLELGASYDIEDRQSYSEAYTYVIHKLGAGLRFSPVGKLQVSAACARSYKTYASAKRNQEWQASVRLLMPFGNGKAKIGYAGQETRSNTPGYSWSEQTANASVEWEESTSSVLRD